MKSNMKNADSGKMLINDYVDMYREGRYIEPIKVYFKGVGVLKQV